MDRLTKHWGNNYVPTKLNWDFVFDLDDETFKNLEDIVIRLAKYEDTGFEPEEIEKFILLIVPINTTCHNQSNSNN